MAFLSVNKNLKIYIFTDFFPYGSGEQFLEQELRFASQYFDEIILLPRFITKDPRQLPANVVVSPICANFSYSEMFKVLVVNFGFIANWNNFFNNFFINNFSFINQIRAFFSYHIESRIIQNKIKTLDNNAIYYSYWLKHSAIAIANSKDLLLRVARGHGSDIYPIKYNHFLQESCINKLDKVFTVSDAGRNFLIDRYNYVSAKIEVAHLGTSQIENYNEISNVLIGSCNHAEFNFLSCSALLTIKRVDRILESLIILAQQLPTTTISWTHAGDGPEYNKISKLATLSPPNLNVILLGSIDNKALQEIYLNHEIDCFINFSTSEGIPVSIMEALSYGVPIVASNVGGNCEIVTPVVGLLIDSNSTNRILAQAILSIIHNKENYTKDNCIRMWNEHFNASINFPKFYENLIFMATNRTKVEYII